MLKCSKVHWANGKVKVKILTAGHKLIEEEGRKKGYYNARKKKQRNPKKRPKRNRKKENRKCGTAKNQNKEKHNFLVAVKM